MVSDSSDYHFGYKLRSNLANRIPFHELEELRLKCDDDGDDFLESLGQRHPEVFTCKPLLIQQYLEEFLKEYRENPGTDSRISMFLEKYSSVPDWVDWNLIRQGQLFFLRNATACSLGLYYYSLVGGFSAPKIVSVLNATNYLASDRDITIRRLVETFHMVVNVMESIDTLKYGGLGWLSVVSVRLLHSRVRRRLVGPKKESELRNFKDGCSWDVIGKGVPINQEDMLGTLLAFSVNVLDCVDKIGICFVSEQDRIAYLHLWRYVGHIIGIRDENNPLTSLSRAYGALDSIVIHILEPDNSSCVLAKHMLECAVGRPPFPVSYVCQCEITRALLGHTAADSLKLPRSLPCALYVKMIFYFLILLSLLVSPFTFNPERTSGRLKAYVQGLLNTYQRGYEDVVMKDEASSKVAFTSTCPFTTT